MKQATVLPFITCLFFDNTHSTNKTFLSTSIADAKCSAHANQFPIDAHLPAANPLPDFAALLPVTTL